MSILMSKTYLSSSPEMERILGRYKGGNIPPLVARNDNEGLISEELLEIFQEGFYGRYGTALLISIITENDIVKAQRSNQGKVPLSEMFSSCKCFQSPLMNKPKEDDAAVVESRISKLEYCQYCPAKYQLTLQEGTAKAYICYTGMIALVAPVYVADRVVAILSVECKKPKEGNIWSKELVEQNGRLPVIVPSSSEIKIDLWQESKRIIQKCEVSPGLQPGELLARLAQNVGINPNIEVSPEGLEAITVGLEKASRYLSDTAGKTCKLQKESLIGWLRAEIASALSSVDTFWDKIQWCFGNLAQLMGVDYILLFSQSKDSANSLQLHCQYGLPQESLPVIQYNWPESTARGDDFLKGINALECIQEIDLRQYRDIPVLGMLYSLYGKGVSYPVLVTCATTVDGGLTYMVLGKKEPVVGAVIQSENVVTRSSGVRWLREDDSQHLITITLELAIIKNVFFSMKKLQETVEEQTNFMESLAHDLRTPIQNIIMAAENLREGRVPTERTSRTITGLITQLQRLDLLAQKAWMLEQIRLDKLIYNDNKPVNYHRILEECRELMTDMAERESIEIYIDPSIKDWRDIYVDAEFLRLVVLNLLHNGIKYSFSNTCIRLGGWQDGAGIGVAMNFGNEGIHILDEEKDRIFQRYFRSNDAVKMNPSGSGIGLALVKEFVDHYKGKIDVTSTEVGFGRFLNIFSIFLPGR